MGFSFPPVPEWSGTGEREKTEVEMRKEKVKMILGILLISSLLFITFTGGMLFGVYRTTETLSYMDIIVAGIDDDGLIRASLDTAKITVLMREEGNTDVYSEYAEFLSYIHNKYITCSEEVDNKE